MNIKELKEKIKDLPDNMQVFVGERLTEFDYGFVNGATVKKIGFFDDLDDDKPLAEENVFVLSED